jgi:Winged helix-turn helix
MGGCGGVPYAKDRRHHHLTGQDEQTRRRWTQASIVLAAGEKLSNTQIAGQVGGSRPTVIRWRGRYAAKGLADQPRSGRPRTVRRDRGRRDDPAAATPAVGDHALVHPCACPSSGVSRMTVARVWAGHVLKPWRTETFEFSPDPELHAKVDDLGGGSWTRRPARSWCAWTNSPDPGAGPHRPALPLRPVMSPTSAS